MGTWAERDRWAPGPGGLDGLNQEAFVGLRCSVFPCGASPSPHNNNHILEDIDMKTNTRFSLKSSFSPFDCKKTPFSVVL